MTYHGVFSTGFQDLVAGFMFWVENGDFVVHWLGWLVSLIDRCVWYVVSKKYFSRSFLYYSFIKRW